MAEFTVRIELHRGTSADYDILHRAMEVRGFSRLITAGSGKVYHLPWAEYYGLADLGCERVRDIAREAANSTGQSNEVFVTEAKCWAWVGLALRS